MGDFWEQSIADAIACRSSDEFADILFAAPKSGADIRLDFASETRDGEFDREQLFAVWSREDVEMLINRLRAALIESDGI